MKLQNLTSLADYLGDAEGAPSSAPEFYDLDSFNAIDMDYLRIEFMRISPSYAFVSSASGTAASKLKQFKQGFEGNTGLSMLEDDLKVRYTAVQKAFKDYGNIDGDIVDWYRKQGRNVFDNWTNRRDVKFLGITNYKEGRNLSDPVVMEQIFQYIKEIASDSALRKTMLLAVPFDLPKAIAMKHLTTLMDAYYDWVFKIDDAKYRQRKQLAGLRERPDALVRKLKVLICKAFNPSMPLWQIGLLANVSYTHGQNYVKKGTTASEKISMHPEIATLTSRALRQGQYLAEHAAMDIFPLSTKLAIPNYDWEKVKARIQLAYPKLKVPSTLSETKFA